MDIFSTTVWTLYCFVISDNQEEMDCGDVGGALDTCSQQVVRDVVAVAGRAARKDICL